VSPTSAHVALVGVTASGKSAAALALARRHPDIELVSIDSMQVYRGMDIGTAKPNPADRAEVPHHLIDLVDPWDEYTVADFQQALAVTLAEIEQRAHRALLVGGTGLYLRAAIDGLTIPGRFPEVRAEVDAEPDTQVLHRRLTELDPAAAERMEPTNRRRIVRALEVTIGSGQPFSSFGPGLTDYPSESIRQLGIRLPRSVVDARIEARWEAMVAAGLVDEVRSLAAEPRGLSRTAAQALGYRELLEHVTGDVPLEEASRTAIVRTRRFARRQERWFRRDPRIEWFESDAASVDDPAALIDELDVVLHAS
jgi:tRNA dimethylallyltransferase